MQIPLRAMAVLAAGLLVAGCATDEPVPDAAVETDTAETDDAETDDAETDTAETDDAEADADAEHDDADAEAEHDESNGMDDIGRPADAADATRTIEVTALDEMAFDPDHIEVDSGEIVTFVVTNSGEAVHEFLLGDAAMQEEHADEMADMDEEEMDHDEPNSISLQPGETRELTWEFGSATTVEYGCHEPGHYEAGMHGEIVVG